MYFPMFVELEGRLAAVVGGGSEALKKIRVLEAFGPEIIVIAERICDEIYELAESNDRIHLKEKEYEAKDIEAADIVVAAAGDEHLGRVIYETCVQQRIPVNVADRKDLCTFIFPAIYRDEPLVVAVSTGGTAPAEAGRVRDMIREGLPGDISRQIIEAGENRKRR